MIDFSDVIYGIHFLITCLMVMITNISVNFDISKSPWSNNKAHHL